MTGMPTKLKDRAARKSRKRDEKKRRIAASAIEALKELGYANTSLRDIAAKSDLSLGMLHYYFEDRSDLIIYCVTVYKEEFVRRVSSAIARAEGREAVIDAFAEALVASIVDDEMIHRLWYDIRTQAMFDETFRPVVAEIEGRLIGILRTALDKAGHGDERDQAHMYYAMIDGVFRYVMQGQIGDGSTPRNALLGTFRGLLDKML